VKIALLHAYSADNAGDGLLVHESLSLLRDAFGESVDLTVAALHPETFVGVDATIVDTSPGFRPEYLTLLRSLDDFDLVVGVGGGYLRAGTPSEAVKALIAHGPQLWAASRTRTPTVYLPQSVGPARGPFRATIGRQLERIDLVCLRDDRSVEQYGGQRMVRVPDLAIQSASQGARNASVVSSVSSVPVLSVRPVCGAVPPLVVDLSTQLGPFDGYVQSETGSNRDTDAMTSLGPQRLVPRAELMTDQDTPRRVVVAVRLHAALMALRAGHYVIHLAYERKGFGAFDDMGLRQYVHNCNKFEPMRVVRQVRGLLEDERVRADYAAQVQLAFTHGRNSRQQLIEEIRTLVGVRT
jgi:polysaccharide pyruvyl transferase WcaK-like protein